MMLSRALVFAVLCLAWGVGSGAARTCEQIMDCMEGLGQLHQGSSMDEACNAGRRALACFNEVVENCRQNHPEMMVYLQPLVDEMNHNMSSLCSGSGASATTPRMMTTTLTDLLATAGQSQGQCDPMACTPDHNRMANEDAACEEMGRVLTCYDDFVVNCGDQYPNLISDLQQQLDNLRAMVSQHCGSGASATTPRMMTTTLTDLLTTAGQSQGQDVEIANGKLRCSLVENVNGKTRCAEGQVVCEEGHVYSREDTSFRAGQDYGQCLQNIWGGTQANGLLGLDEGFPLPRTPEAGWTVCLTGSPTRYDRASVDFLGDEGRLFVSHFDIRMGEGMDWSFGDTVVINEAVMGWDGRWDWADQDTYHPYPYPFHVREQFTVRIVAERDNKLVYYVDGKRIASRYLRSSVSQVTKVVIQGTVHISRIDVWCQ